MNKLKYIIAVCILTLGFSGVSYAQAPTPDPVLQACEEIADKAKRLEIENSGIKAQLDIANQRIVLGEDRLKNKEEQVQFYKAAYEKGTKIDTNSSLIIENLRFQVNDYRNEVAELRRENDKLRSSRNWRTALGFAAGFGTGIYVGKQ